MKYFTLRSILASIIFSLGCHSLFCYTYESIKQELKNNEISYVMFSFCDILGEFKELTMPLKEALDALKYGITFDGSSVLGYSSITTSDLILKPDFSTFRIIPWTKDKHKTGWFICDIYDMEGKPLPCDPRAILKKTVQEAYDLGYKFNVGPELEFFLINNQADIEDSKDKPYYFNSADTIEGYQEKVAFLNMLEELLIPVEKIHREVASEQYEISIHYGDALKKADEIIISKYALKLLAPRYNLHATFMPKPYKDKSGSGMHIHYSIVDTKTNINLFYDSNKPYNLSSLAQSFIAGNLEYVYDLSALFNPGVNSYKRLVPGYEAPIYIAWGIANRSTLVRIPVISHSPELAMRAEIRCPDALCNPYLAFAALLHSGLQGIKEKLNPVVHVTENLYKLNQEEINAKNINALPTSLHQSVEAFKKSNQAVQLMGPNAHQAYVNIKQKELRDFDTSITDWEQEHYL